jgi:hypothetical protein
LETSTIKSVELKDNLAARFLNYLAHEIIHSLMIAYGSNDCFLEDNLSMTTVLCSHNIQLIASFLTMKVILFNKPLKESAAAVRNF